VEDQDRTEQTPEEEKDVEAHKAHNKAKAAPEAARNDEDDDVEGHMAKHKAKNVHRY
jgi:hypothetical protein